jgi:hypothetical protein
LDTIGTLFEKILLSSIPYEVSGCGILRDERIGFRPKHSTALQLTHFVEGVSRNFDEKRLTGPVFLDVAKAFDTVLVDGLLYKLAILNFPLYLVKTISSYLNNRTFGASFQSATSTIRRTWAKRGTGWYYFTCPAQSVYTSHAFAFPPHRVGSLCGRHGHHSQVLPTCVARQISGDLSQRPRMVAE